MNIQTDLSQREKPAPALTAARREYDEARRIRKRVTHGLINEAQSRLERAMNELLRAEMRG